MICTDLIHGIVRNTVPEREFVVALGNFDGVHVAHQKLIRLACSLRDRLFPDAAVAAWFFSELPETYLPVPPVERLTDESEKQKLLLTAGAEYTFSYPFPELRNLSPEQFCQKILLSECHARGAVCGYNFRFGKYASGTPELLRSVFPGAFEELPEVRMNGKTVSSTAVRQSLKNGMVETANQMLGHSFSLTAPVAHGKHLGTSLGIPTVNLAFPAGMLIPRHGVYATETLIDGQHYPSVSNVGVRPTVEKTNAANCETYVIGYSGDLYGKNVTVSFYRFLREERRFESVEQLQAAIRADIRTTEDLFRKQLKTT